MLHRRNALLRHIRRVGVVGRLELGRQANVSRSRVCEVVQEMLTEGLLLEELDGQERRGRRPVPIRLDPDRGRIIGFDFEAKRMRLVVVDFAGNVLVRSQQKLRPPRNRQAFIDRLLRFLDKALDRVRQDAPPALGIGLAAPGIIDRNTGTLLHYDFIEAARNVPLRDQVAAHTDLPCSMDNNVRAYALTEWLSGAAQDLSSFICLAVRSGVAAAVMHNGRLIEGSHGFSGEAGRFAIPGDRAASQWLTFEETVSEQALDVDAEAKGFELPPARARRAGELVGAQIAALATLLDPEAVVLAGALIQPGSPLWPSLEGTFRRFVLPDIADRVQLLPSRVGPFAAAIGAAHQCFQMLHPAGPD